MSSLDPQFPWASLSALVAALALLWAVWVYRSGLTQVRRKDATRLLAIASMFDFSVQPYRQAILAIRGGKDAVAELQTVAGGMSHVRLQKQIEAIDIQSIPTNDALDAVLGGIININACNGLAEHVVSKGAAKDDLTDTLEKWILRVEQNCFRLVYRAGKLGGVRYGKRYMDHFLHDAKDRELFFRERNRQGIKKVIAIVFAPWVKSPSA